MGTPGRTDAFPVAGDWDGDGRDFVGIYQQADATVLLVDDERVALAPAALGQPGKLRVLPGGRRLGR